MKPPDASANLTTAIRRPHRWRMALAGLVILAAGVTLGIAGTLLVVPPRIRPPMPVDRAMQFLLGRLGQELELSEEQVEELKGILKVRMNKLDEIRQKARPEIEEQLELLKSEVSEVLTPEQQDRWQRFIEHMDRMFRRGMRRGPGGRGGPGPGGPGGPDGRFREGRGPFRGPRRPDPNDPNGPRDWQREGRRPPWMRRPDADRPPPPPEPVQGEERTGAEQEPNQP